MSNNTGNSSNVIRTEVWEDDIKERLLDDLTAYGYVEWIDFPDGTTYTQPTIGGATTQNVSEGVPIGLTAIDKGEWNLTINKYVGSGTGISKKLLQDSRWGSELEGRFIAEQHRALMENLETDIMKAAGPNASGGGGQTASATNAINGANHRFVASGTGETIVPKDFSLASYGLKKANVSLSGLTAIVDPSVAFAIETSTNIQNISSNPMWEGIIETGMLNANGMRFVRNVNGFDVWVSNYLDDANETIGAKTTTAGKQNLFFAANPQVGSSPFRGAWRQMPEVDADFDPQLQEHKVITTARWGVKTYRLENIVCVLSDTDQVSLGGLMSRHTNNDGLVVNYGPRDAEDDGLIAKGGSSVPAIQTMRWDFTYENLPGFDADASGGATPDTFSDAVPFIPAGSIISRAFLVATTAWTGTGTMDVGFEAQDSTDLDVDGLYDGLDVDHADTGLATVGAAPIPNGVCVQNTSGTYDPDWMEAASATTSNLYVRAFAATGSFTAGAATLVVEFIAPSA